MILIGGQLMKQEDYQIINNFKVQLQNKIIMYSNMMLPIQLTKILYSDWSGQISVSSQDSEIYGKCLNGPGSVTFKNGNKYQGNFYNGLLSGHGKFTWLNGIIYEGQFTDNRITGKGTYQWPDGSIYEGSVKDGLRHGFGKITLDQATYEGEWVEGKKHGKGKIVFKSGSIFEGNFQNDMKHGFGKMYYYPSGNYFQGYWAKDNKQGKGTMNWIDIREKYYGQWKQNLQHGQGTHIWLQSKGEGKYMRNRYEGGWAKGVRDGFGIFYYANGSKYQGYWKDNMKQGYAFYTNESGIIEQILFQKDRMMKTQKQQIDDKKGTKKDVQPNVYSLSLRIQQYFEPQKPNLQLLYNLLLRNNTQLKTWYKAVSTFFDQHSQLSFCLNLEGCWKIIRGLKMLGDLTLANFNRGLNDLNVKIQSLLGMVDKSQKIINYESCYFKSLAKCNVNLQWKQKEFKIEKKDIDVPFEECNVHNKERNLLFREFVQLLVWMSYNLEPNYKNPKQSVQKLLLKITPYLENITKNVKSGSSDNVSENVSSVSKTQKSITPYFRKINNELLLDLKSVGQQKMFRNDTVVKLRELIGYGLKSKVFEDTQLALLERIMQKYMDPEVLSRPRSENWSNSNISAKLLNLMNYQLIEFEFVELIYFLLVKKLPTHKQTQENKIKYQRFIQSLKQSKKQAVNKQKALKQFNNEVRYIQSHKLNLRKQLIAKRLHLEEQKKKRQSKKQQLLREAKERQLMDKENIDIKEQSLQQEQSQLEI